MVLDPVPIHEPVEIKPMAVIYARKKALGMASNILISGAERLKKLDNGPDFQIELLRLRQNWRLKKVSDNIIGDLSFRTAGSKYMHPGNFEVTKIDDADLKGPNPSTLRVTIPSELQGVAYIKVVTQKDQEDLCSAKMSLLTDSKCKLQVGEISSWQKKLEFAQNVLFCKELFNQLAREAVQLQATIPHVVIGNRIRATLLPGIQLIISLCHSSTYQEYQEETKKKTDDPHDHVLEHSLHQLLREIHYKNTHYPLPHSGHAVGMAKKRLLAGPHSYDRHELGEMTKNQTLLEQIIAQAQHIFMRKRTQYVLDTLARDVKDPQITSHWNALNSPTLSWVKINITSHGYDTITRTSLVIHVKERSLKAICRDGRVMHMSYEPQELRDLILQQICQHQITGLQSLSRCMAWQLLSNSNHLGIGDVEPLGNANSILIASPLADRIIAVQVRCDPQIIVKAYVSHSPKEFFAGGPLVQGKFWENLGSEFREVKFDKMEGKNFLNKMEYLMAACSKIKQ